LKAKGKAIEDYVFLFNKFNVKLTKPNRFEVKFKKFTKDIESEDAGVWVCILNSIKDA